MNPGMKAVLSRRNRNIKTKSMEMYDFEPELTKKESTHTNKASLCRLV